MNPRSAMDEGVPKGGSLALAAALLVLSACGGRETGVVRFDPDPPAADGVHEVEYQASCQSNAECVVAFSSPGESGREIFGGQWSHRFHASTGQRLYLGVTVRRRCSGNFALGNIRCDQAHGSARVAVFVDGERVASEVEYSRNRGVLNDYAFGVSVRHRITADSAASRAG